MGIAYGVPYIKYVIRIVADIGRGMTGGKEEVDEGTTHCSTVGGIVHINQRGLRRDKHDQSDVQAHFPREISVERPFGPGREFELFPDGETVDVDGRVGGSRAGAGAGAGAVEPEGHDDVVVEREEEEEEESVIEVEGEAVSVCVVGGGGRWWWRRRRRKWRRRSTWWAEGGR